MVQYEYERPALATDCVIFGFDGGELKLLLLKREKAPFENTWALPGGFVFMHETTETAAKRLLREKAGIGNVFIEQLYTFSSIDRDPRERIVSVSYFALVNKTQFALIAGRDTIQAAWHPISALPELGFDHSEIVSVAIERLKGKVRYQPIGFELLDLKFTLSQLQSVYEAILQAPIDKRNFRKKIIGMGLLKQLDEKEQNVPRKAAFYYSFDKKAYEELTKKGFHFEL
ncbi:NUDIX domain-containing protein [Fluviicola sp.]|uniref:NUDIX hydrolase n=1 Tax=Fluviicola sp. TaxID=1917219 RepID=UPI0031D08DF4